MTDGLVTVTLTEREWERLIYDRRPPLGPIVAKIETAIAEQLEPKVGDWRCD